MPDSATDGINTVKVTILGRDYKIKSDEEERVRAIANSIIDKINGISGGFSKVNQIDVLVMTAFELADDYLSLKDEFDQFRGLVSAKTADLTVKIESELNQTPGD